MTTQAAADRLMGWVLQKDRRLLGLDIGRLARAAGTGGVCGAVQLALLDLLIAFRWDPAVANTVAFLLSAQLNFALSLLFIWGDRQADTGGLRRLATRWVAFHGSVLTSAALNLLVFQAACQIMSPLPASALGIVSTAVLNFVVQDRLVFRNRGQKEAR